MTYLQEAIIYLLAAIVSVLISKRLGFGSVLGYLCAGILIGPFGLGFIREPDHILHFAELGVVFLLFIIGLELKPARLWVMRKMVFGLGTAQVLVSAALLALLAWLYGLDTEVSVVIGLILMFSYWACALVNFFLLFLLIGFKVGVFILCFMQNASPIEPYCSCPSSL